MDLDRGDRRSLEYRQSRVGENSLVRLTSGPVLYPHVAVVGRGSAPGETVALIVRTHAVKTIAARQLTIEVIDVG